MRNILKNELNNTDTAHNFWNSEWSQNTKQTEWKTYRQSLRDITKTASPKMRTDISNMLDVKSVTWPTKPS